MAESLGFELEVTPGNADKVVSSFKEELKKAKTEAIEMSRKFGEFSPQAVAAAKAFGALKDEFADLNQLADGLTDEKKFASLASVGSGIAGGFSAASGAISLATGESAEFEKAMLKVQSAMAITSGLAQVSELGKQWNTAKAAIGSFTVVQKLNTAATESAAVVQKLFTGAVNTSSTGFKVLKGAIIGTGIGALVVALGYVIANFDSLKATIYKLLPFLETVEKFITKIVQVVGDFVGVTSEATRAADALRDGIEGQNEKYDQQIQLLSASGAKSKDIRKIKNEQYDDEIKRLEKIAQLQGDQSDDDKKKISDLKFQQQLLKAEQAKEDKEAAEEAAKKAEEAHKKELDKQKEQSKKLAEEKKKAAEEAAKKDEEEKQRTIDALKEKHSFELSLLKAQGKGTTGIRSLQIDEEVKLLKDSGGKFAEGITALEREKVLIAAQAKTDAEAKQKEVDDEKAEKDAELKKEQDALRIELMKEGEDQELAQLQAKYDAMREIVKGNEELTTALVAAESEAQAVVRKKWDDIALQQKRDNLSQLGGILSGASAILGKNTAVGKGLAVADATIQTYLGATKALSASSGIPIIGTALGIANAALIVANGLKSVKTILSTKTPGGDGGASAPPAAATTSPAVSTAPTMSGIQSTLLEETTKLTEGKDSLKAYVVESEITQKQERQRAITQTANF